MTVGTDNSTFFVDVTPSTLRFPFNKDGVELKRGMERDGYYSTSKDGTLLEGHVTFDFSEAVEIYREEVGRLDGLREREKLLRDAVIQNKTDCRAYNSTDTTEKIQSSVKAPQIQSIMLKMDQETQVKFDRETQILNQALIILSCFGLFLIVAIVWTGWQLTQKSKRRVDRQKLSVVDSVPRDIRPQERQVTPELSPLRPSAVSRGQNERNSQTCHETLHLVSLRDVATPMHDRAVRNADSSPRHWYEEFLNPRINTREHGVGRIGTGGEEKDETSRSLFVPGSSESGTSALGGNEMACGGQPLAENHSSDSRPDHEASEHKNQETEVSVPIKSPFSPSPASFSLLELADHIETSSTPFAKPTSSVFVSPDEIKQLSDRIREPVVSPSHQALYKKAVPVESVIAHEGSEQSSTSQEQFQSSFDDADSIDGIGSKQGLVSKEQAKSAVESITVFDQPEVDDVNLGNIDSIKSSASHYEAKDTSDDEEPPVAPALSDKCKTGGSDSSDGAGFMQSVNGPVNTNATALLFPLTDKVSSSANSESHIIEYNGIDETHSQTNDSMSSTSLLVSAAGDYDDDSFSSASLLVSVDGDATVPQYQGLQIFQDKQEDTEIDQFISDEIQCYSADNKNNVQSADEESASDNDVPHGEDVPCEITSPSETSPQSSLEEPDGEEEQLDPVDKEKELSAHDMKHNMIQELKESSRFKFKKNGTNGASSFAEELAAVTGTKAADTSQVITNDFASSLAKRVAEKDHKAPVKKTERKAKLTPAEASPDHTDDSEFLSDYW